ncbi:MAG: hypothetical protein SP1CHLAM54_18130 [Chlamydiia bacterium]|nr:hypothetical protein [Chlamydiia bacterium]MCH9616699.1 hypothetical protein [Chlamydiia bacterium]MCH9629430.1 hypothetical protein [Chlamydiia bacterium]
MGMPGGGGGMPGMPGMPGAGDNQGAGGGGGMGGAQWLEGLGKQMEAQYGKIPTNSAAFQATKKVWNAAFEKAGSKGMTNQQMQMFFGNLTKFISNSMKQDQKRVKKAQQKLKQAEKNQ